MYHQQELDWLDPLSAAQALADHTNYLALLYSGAQYSYSGNFCYLAWDALEVFSNSETELKTEIINSSYYHFGYQAYEAGPSNLPSAYVEAPKQLFFKAANILIFDINEQKLSLLSNSSKKFQLPTAIAKKQNQQVIYDFTSNMSKEAYLQKIAEIKEKICEGAYYQINLTRKFFAECKNFAAIENFIKLAKLCPSPYAAFLKFKDLHILSSSPERFISCDGSKINTRPIKGTLAKDKGTADDLYNSGKDRAENLMITDLMRNDLRSYTNNMQVDKLFAVDSFNNLHHMSSSISAELADNLNCYDLLKNCLPPGSMTGAPKIAAMEAIEKFEQQQRGIYSGALGYFGPNNICDFSVIIRTIIQQQERVEFQVGGGIIYDSNPEEEWQETMIKAENIAKTLNIPLEQFKNL